MEENLRRKLEQMQETQDDFKDFDETDAPLSQDDIEIAEVNLQEQMKKLAQDDEASMFHKQNINEQEAQPQNETEPEKDSNENIPQTTEKEKPQEEKTVQSPWEEYAQEEDNAVKKYIFYVSKDFVSIIDKLSTDERTAYINDAIQKKIDIEHENHKKNAKRKILTHMVIMILTFIIMTPFVLLLAHKAILATFENYKYSQESFEKLYKSRFENDRAYLRSVQYNKEQEQKRKNAQ